MPVQSDEKWCVTSTSPDQICSGCSAVQPVTLSGQAGSGRGPGPPLFPQGEVPLPLAAKNEARPAPGGERDARLGSAPVAGVALVTQPAVLRCGHECGIVGVPVEICAQEQLARLAQP